MPVENLIENIKYEEVLVDKPVYIDAIIEQEVEVIKEVIKEVPVEKIIEVPVEHIKENPII